MKIIKLQERLLLEYNSKQIQAFKDKFGDEAYTKFDKYHDRIKNLKDKEGNSYPTDINHYLNNVDKEEMDNILKRLETREYTPGYEQGLDVEGKLIPPPANTKKLIYSDAENKLWYVTDYTDMIEMSKGTGDGSIGGNETGWCIGGRYEVPSGQVKVSQAKDLFYKYLYKTDGGYYVLVKPNTKYCIIFDGTDIISVTDNDDNELLGDQDEYNKFIEENKFLYKVFGIKDWLKEVFIYDGVTKVPEEVVFVIVNGGVKKIGNSAFSYCTSLRQITLPNSVTKIGNGAFQSCISLPSIDIPNSVTKIGNGAFSNCKSLQSINIPSGVTEIGEYAFQNCISLPSIDIPDSVTKIGGYSFQSCYSLQSIEIPDSVNEIGNDVFDGCSKYLVIKCHKGSYADWYTKENDIEVEYM